MTVYQYIISVLNMRRRFCVLNGAFESVFMVQSLFKKCEAETKQTLNFKTPKDYAAAN